MESYFKSKILKIRINELEEKQTKGMNREFIKRKTKMTKKIKFSTCLGIQHLQIKPHYSATIAYQNDNSGVFVSRYEKSTLVTLGISECQPQCLPLFYPWE